MNKSISPNHFLVSSVTEWRVGNDPVKLVEEMKQAGHCWFLLFFVPVDISTNYQIRFFAPVVEGTTAIGAYELEPTTDVWNFIKVN